MGNEGYIFGNASTIIFWPWYFGMSITNFVYNTINGKFKESVINHIELP